MARSRNSPGAQTRILLSGFEPFGDFATNPSWDALVQARDEGLLDAGMRLVRVPVAYDSAFETFEEAAIEFRPQAAISFGVYGSLADSSTFRAANNPGPRPATIYIETTARNRDGAAKPDNSGEQRGATPIVADAPATLPATFPAESLRESLQTQGFKAELSGDAGGYLCNHLFFRATHAFGQVFPYGFVHVPPVDSMGGVLSLQELARAMAIMANTLAGTLEVT